MDGMGLQHRADIQTSFNVELQYHQPQVPFVLTHTQVNPVPPESHCCDGQTVGWETRAKVGLLHAAGGRGTNSQSIQQTEVQATTRATSQVAWKRL